MDGLTPRNSITEKHKAWAAFKERMRRGDPVVIPELKPSQPKRKH